MVDVASEDQLADVLMKMLDKKKFKKHTCELLMDLD